MPERPAPGRVPDVEKRVAELARLRRAPGRRPMPRFVAALRDPALPVAKTAAMGLCDRKAVVAALAELLADDEANLRWRACSLAWFFMIRDFVPHLIGALRDGDPMVRVEAAWALRCADTDPAAAALLKALKDPQRMVAHYASWTLRRILRPRCPQLPSLRGARIPELPLLPERARRARAPARGVDDDARAFDQLACWADLPVYRAPRAAPAPATDGRRDGAYRRAAAAELIHIDGYPAPPLRKTDFRAVCTADALHLHIRCAYRGRRELGARHRGYGQPVHTDNSVEVFLDPSGRGRPPYFQICVNTRNARCDALAYPPGHTWQPGAGPKAAPWRPRRIRSAVRIEKGFWNVELAVPFAELGLSPGRINKLWRMNVVRNAHLAEGSETTSFCDLGDYDAHRPERFGYLWVDAGSVVNADGAIFSAAPVPLRGGLKGWRVLKGSARVRGGELIAPPGGAVLRWGEPVAFEAFELSAEVMIRHQVRLLFSPDAANPQLSWMAAYINPINEINIAGLHRWEHWAPSYPGQLSIFKEVYPRLTHSRWYRIAVRVRPGRVQTLLDGTVHMELPNPNPSVRHFGLGLVGEGRLRKLRLRPLQ